MTTASRPDGRTRNGGARPGAGALKVRFRLSRETAQCLRILTLARRGLSGRDDLEPADVLAGLVRDAFAEYEAMITEHEE